MMIVMRHRLLRRLASIFIALMVSLIVSYYLSMSHEYLIPVSALFVMLTSIGNPVYQGVKRFLFLMLIIIALSYLLPPHQMVYQRIYDVSIGAVIGILVNLLVLPRRADSEFRVAMVPVLKSYQIYFNSIIGVIFNRSIEAEQKIKNSQGQLEYQIQQLPSWVNETGFDHRLKKGYQYFLLKTQYIAKILFAMHHAARATFDKETLTTTHDDFYTCVAKINEFFTALITVFELKKLNEGVDDFEQQLRKLDNQFQTMLPINLELLDMENDLVCFYELIYGLNDLRSSLIKLGQALR